MEESEMNENWCAFCISILKSVTPEQAFDYLEGKISLRDNFNLSITDEDLDDMIKLKATHTYLELGQMYGLSENAIHKRIKRYKENMVLAIAKE